MNKSNLKPTKTLRRGFIRLAVIAVLAAPASGSEAHAMPVDPTGAGSLVIPDWTSYDRLALVVSNLGDGVHDPDADDWTPSQWTVWVERLEPLPIFADGFESGDTSAWSSTVP